MHYTTPSTQLLLLYATYTDDKRCSNANSAAKLSPINNVVNKSRMF